MNNYFKNTISASYIIFLVGMIIVVSFLTYELHETRSETKKLTDLANKLENPPTEYWWSDNFCKSTRSRTSCNYAIGYGNIIVDDNEILRDTSSYPESIKYDVEFKIDLYDEVGIEKTPEQIDDEVDNLLIDYTAKNPINKVINYAIIGQVNKLNDVSRGN